MSDEQVPPTPPEADGPPPPPSDPPAAAPPPPPANEASAGGPPENPGGSPENPNRTVYLWLSYAWIFVLFPFLLEKDDEEVKWHAKHGLVITGAEFLLQIVMWIIGSQLACIGCIAGPVIWVAFLVFRIMAAVKATKGGRLTIPGLSDLANNF